MRIKTVHIALLISILALAVSLFTATQVSRNSNDAVISALIDQNQQLQAQIDALTGNGSAVPENGSDATDHNAVLTARTWPDGQGADVTLTLEGSADTQALLRIMMGSAVINEAPCQWNGSVLTATIPVDAGNGYTYSMVVGSESITLASPENPVYPELVYLADALTSYCNLVVGEYSIENDVLTLETCYAQIHTPQLDSTDVLTCADARLVLRHRNGKLSEYPFSPVPDEEPGTYTCDIAGATFRLPKLEVGEQVDLWLEVTLSDGQVLTTCAATWYAMNDGFSMAAG